MKNRLSMLLFILLMCSCNCNDRNGVLAAIYIFSTTNDPFSDFYIEIRNDKTIECTKGMVKEGTEDVIYENKKITPGVENFISDKDWGVDVVNYETLSYEKYRRRQKSKILDNNCWDRLEKYIYELSKNSPGNIFDETTHTNEWRSDNAGVVVMYKGDVYTFWHDSKQEAEKNLYRCLEDISPIKIVVPDRGKRPPSKVVLVKKSSIK